jgi:hypothetical protein
MCLTVYVSNVSEDVWDLIQTLPEREREAEVAENRALSDRELWSNIRQRKLVLVMPASVEKSFLKYYRLLAPHQNLKIIVPEFKTGQTCIDLISDKKKLFRLVKLCNNQSIRLVSYSATPQFWQLVRRLEEMGVKAATPESPMVESAWTPNFFGSKSGIRQLVSELQPEGQSWMSHGKICFGVHDTANLAADWYCQHNGVVIKVHKAHAGLGVLIFKPGELPDKHIECVQALVEILSGAPYWSRFPVVVERLVDVDISIGGGNPNVEYRVNHKGEVKFLFSCGMRVTNKGMFQGVEIHQRALPKRVLDQLKMIGQRLGEAYSQAGYRGYFDVDCLATKDGRVLLAESNVRRTGGTHAYHLARYLVGKQFLDERYVLAINNHKLPGGVNVSFDQAIKALERYLYSPKTKEGIVLVSASLLSQGQLAYVIFGKTKKRAMGIEERMMEIVEKMQ